MHRLIVYEITGAEHGEAPWQIVEDALVENWEQWQETLKGPGIAQVVAEWPDYCDADSVLTVFADKIG